MGAGYAASRSHAEGRTLGIVLARADLRPSDRVCDVGTGTGHTALAIAPRVSLVVGADPAGGMLAQAVRMAAGKGIRNALWARAEAEALPFREAAFDVVVSRTAAHHFRDLAQACREWGRILKPGGRCVVTDLAGYEDPEVHRFVHEIEVLHDPSHVGARTAREWRGLLEGAGLEVGQVEEGLTELPEGMRLSDWLSRSRTPPEAGEEIRRRLRKAPGILGVREEGAELFFDVKKLVVSARKPG